MTAIIQIHERHQNWPPIQLYERHQNAPVLLNLAAIKFLLLTELVTINCLRDQNCFSRSQIQNFVRASKLQQLK